MYGITASTIRDRVNGLLLTAESTPSVSVVEEVIAEQTALVNARLQSKAIQTPVTDPGERLAVRSVIIQLVISHVELMRSRGTTSLVEETFRRSMAVLDAIADNAGNLPASMAKSPGSPDIPYTRPPREGCSWLDRVIKGGRL